MHISTLSGLHNTSIPIFGGMLLGMKAILDISSTQEAHVLTTTLTFFSSISGTAINSAA